MPNKHTFLHHHLIHRHKSQTVDMTQGNIAGHILRFALPLLVGNLFQQMYNTVDTWVVGNYVNNAAFSAVGTVGPIINMLIGFFMGLSSGAGVVISQYYGAKQFDKVKQAVHTSIVMTLLLGIVFTIVGIGMIPLMLQLMAMPADAAQEATVYLTIYFSGVIGLMIYNMGAGILRAVGDSKRPFYYLVVCAVLNTVLDLLFVLGMGFFGLPNMGVEGVALATVISQCASAVLVCITLLRTDSCVKVELRSLQLHFPTLKKIVGVGIPAALQMAVTSFSNIFVQSYINFFQTDCMSGWTAYSKIDQILFLPMQSIALASTTFVGQNLGCNQVERSKKGVRASVLLAMVSTAILLLPLMLFAPEIVTFLNSKQEVVDYGAMFIRWLSPFYLACVFNQVYAGALRGSGDAKAPMIIMLASFVVFRQLYLFIMSQVWNEVLPIVMSYPAGWLVCSVTTSVYYHRANLGKNRLVDELPSNGNP